MDSRKRSITQTEGTADGPPAAKVKLGDDLPRVEDDLTDATHKKYDERVNEEVANLGSGESLPNIASYTYLLMSIVEESGGKLDSKYEKKPVAKGLLKEYPVLLEELKAAWKIRSYRNIRTLAILRADPGIQGTSNFNGSASYTVADAWGRPYSGSNHELLLNNLNSMERVESYSNTVAILQSSGSGKSRMVHEQATLVFTLPFNLRPDEENKDVAYPPPDVDVRKYLIVACDSISHTKFRFALFFKNLFSIVAQKLPLAFKNLSSRDEKEVAAAWRRYLDVDNNRSDLYNEVVQLSISDTSSKRDPVVAEREAVESLVKLLEHLENYCDFQGPASHIKIVLYFDEAHVLAEVDRRDGQNILYDHYDAICGTLNLFINQPIFALFLSTHSSLSVLAAPGGLARSARMRKARKSLQAPITETPFDCSPTLPVDPRKLTFDQICEIDFLAQLGRPLFWSVLEASDNKDNVRTELVNNARSKLLWKNELDAGRHTVKIEAQSALLDILVMLDFEPRRGHSHHHQVEMVASHMRIAYSVPSHREYFRSGYPSEPILAEAAARQIAEFRRQEDGNVMASMLKHNFENGLIALGERGEVVMRVLLMEAYIRAVSSELEKGKILNFSKGCSLITFVKELFTDKYATVVLTSRPDNLKSEQTLQEAFPDAIVRFTHFVKAADATVLGTDALLAAFIRGMAYICWNSQELVDFAIPILRKKSDLSPAGITVILIQVKRRMVKGSLNMYTIDQRRLHVFPANLASKVPYVTLVAELGVQIVNPRTASAPSTPTKSKVSSAPIPPPTPSTVDIPRQPQRQHHQLDTHPRYSIRAYGCSNTVYKGISEAERSLYRFLLASHGLFGEHPRQDRDSLKKLHELKPEWSTDCSYDWFKFSAEGPEETVEEEAGDYLEVGTSVPEEMEM